MLQESKSVNFCFLSQSLVFSREQQLREIEVFFKTLPSIIAEQRKQPHGEAAAAAFRVQNDKVAVAGQPTTSSAFLQSCDYSEGFRVSNPVENIEGLHFDLPISLAAANNGLSSKSTEEAINIYPSPMLPDLSSQFVLQSL